MWLDQIAQDLRHAARLMRWSPGFTIVTVLTLALGLSTNITIFSLVNLLLFRPLPVKDGDRLVVVLEQRARGESPRGLSWADYRDYRTQVAEFSDVLALAFRPAHLSVTGRSPDRAWIEAVSGNYFSMLGVAPHTGRLFLPGEGEQPGADPIVVLAHHYWQTHLGADPTIVGRTIAINGRPLTVIGITAPAFTSAQWSLAPSAFVPATLLSELFPGDERLFERRSADTFRVMAHLRPDVDVRQATAAVQGVAQRLTRAYRPEDANARMLVQPEVRTRPVPGVSRFVPLAAAVFMVMAGLVLFIACANVANLMFSRALGRQREMGIRTAIGASRGRLIRQLLTESVLLAVIAGGTGLAFSYGSGQVLAGIAPQADIPVRPDERWDWLVAAFTVLVSIVAGVVTGLVPALRSTTLDVHTILKGGGTAGARARQGFRNSLVMSQVAVCVVVLVCGGLFLRSLHVLSVYDLGFRAEGLLMASLDLGLPGYGADRGRRLLDQLIGRVRTLPGVESAGVGSSVPFDTSFDIRTVTPAAGSTDRPADSAADGHQRARGAGTSADGARDRGRELRAVVNRVDPEYLRTMGTTLLQGRGFVAQDQEFAPRVAIVNQTLARRLWPDQDPIGQRFRWQRGADTVQRRPIDDDPIEVIGLVRDGKYVTLGEAPRGVVYVPLAQAYGPSVTLHVRTASGDPLALVPSLRRAIQDLDPDLPFFNVRTMPDHLRGSVFAFLPMRMGAMFAGVQGTLGLILAVMSVYGVVAWSVRQQTRDIGVRMALGARNRDLLQLVAHAALKQTAIGLAFGVMASVGLARLLAGLLYGLDPMNLPVFVVVVVLVLAIALLACWLPARRVLKVDPVTALRAD